MSRAKRAVSPQDAIRQPTPHSGGQPPSPLPAAPPFRNLRPKKPTPPTPTTTPTPKPRALPEPAGASRPRPRGGITRTNPRTPLQFWTPTMDTEQNAAKPHHYRSRLRLTVNSTSNWWPASGPTLNRVQENIRRLRQPCWTCSNTPATSEADRMRRPSASAAVVFIHAYLEGLPAHPRK